MAGDGTEFSIDLAVKGGGDALSAAEAVANLASRLGAAETAATAAADAVKAGTASFNAAEKTANQASLAVEKIGAQMLTLQGLGAKSDAAAEAVARIGIQADALRGKLQAAMAGGDADAIALASARLTAALERQSIAQSKAVLAANAAAGAEAKIAALSTRQAEAAAKAAETARAVAAEAVALDRLKAASTAATAAQTNIAKAMDAAKTKANEATKALQAAGKPINAGEAAGALGKLGGPLGRIGQQAFDAADAFKKMGSSLGAAGPYVAVAVAIIAIATAAAAVTGAVLAGIGAITLWGIKLADTDGKLKKQSDRMSANFKKIFGGLNIKPLTEGVSKVVSLFDEGSASAKAISAIFNSLFQPIVDAATGAIPMLIAKFIQFEILVMKGMIRLKLIWQEWGSIITTVAQVVGVVVLTAVVTLAVVIGVLAAGVAAMAVGFTIALAIIGAFVAAVIYLTSKVVEAGAAIIGALGEAFDWLSGMSLAEIGTTLIDGLIAGLVSAGPGVLKAITGVADGAINAAKAALGIASPSKVFAEIGMHTAAGMEEGIDGGASGVEGSMTAMVEPPAPAASGAAPASASVTATGGLFAGATFVFQGVGGDVKKFAEEFRDQVNDLMAQAGRAVPSA